MLLSGRGLRFELAIGNEFQIELKDLSASDFGKGSSLGTHGFTQNEWVEYLKEKKHAPQQALQCSVVTPNLNDSLNKYWAYLVFKKLTINNMLAHRKICDGLAGDRKNRTSHWKLEWN